jgi:hypothetical protein
MAAALSGFEPGEVRAQGSGDVFSSSGEVFGSSGRTCGWAHLRYDWDRVLPAVRNYPNGAFVILTPQERSRLADEFGAWNESGGQPMRLMAPCFGCSQEYELCIVYDGNNVGPPAPPTNWAEVFASSGGPPPGTSGGGSPPGSGGDEFGSNGGSSPDTGDGDEAPPWDVLPVDPQVGQCPVGQVYKDIPDASPELRYSAGFSHSFYKRCFFDLLTVQNLTIAALAKKYQAVQAGLYALAAPGVIDAVIHPPGVSANPNPYLRGREEGARLCEWALKVAPAALARCRPKGRPETGPKNPLPPYAAALVNLNWLRGLNPTRSNLNCGQIVVAVDAILSGRWAGPAPPGSCAGTTVGELQSILGGKFGPYRTAVDIESSILSAPEGARGVVLAETPKGHVHYFNVVRFLNQTVLLDGQAGKVMSWNAYKAMGFTKFSLMPTN